MPGKRPESFAPFGRTHAETTVGAKVSCLRGCQAGSLMYPVVAIADEILRQAKSRGRPLTPLQLMKLVYIAFGFYIAGTGKRLFPEEIEAWKFGPVIPDLYNMTRRWGRQSIPFSKISDVSGYIDDKTKEFLGRVVDYYSHLNGIALSQLTHQHGSPWHQIYRKDPYIYTNLEIPQDIIRDYYVDLVADHDANAVGQTP